MLINLLWDEPKAGSFAVITTGNITLQDIEKKKPLSFTGAKTPPCRAEKKLVLRRFKTLLE
jgi:hypothetical protein